jgi:hypothetical protein
LVQKKLELEEEAFPWEEEAFPWEEEAFPWEEEAFPWEVQQVVAELQSQWTLVECSCSGDTEQPKLRRRQ